MEGNDLVLAIVTLGGLLLAAIAIHLCAAMMKDGTLNRNGGMGIRTRATMASDETWAAAHRAALPHFYRAAYATYGVIAVVLAIGLLYWDYLNLVVSVGSLVACSALLWFGVASGIAGNRVAKVVLEQTQYEP